VHRFERFKRAANLSITYVPYPGNAPTVNAVLGGHVTAGLANYADLIGHLQGGKLRALATATIGIAIQNSLRMMISLCVTVS
jgi:tripartite-type tricarboxylate transporter receptor subunit TctC